MSDKKAKAEKTQADETPAGQPDQDTEGHSMWISPSMSRDLVSNRNREIEREARERQRAKEAKRR